MAKRGYRGKHPNNDMKVAPTSTKAANYSKLTDEYNKTGAKNKYDYIKSHDGFYPQASMTVLCHQDIATDEQIILISTDGTSRTYIAKTATAEASNQFRQNEGSGAAQAANTAAALKSCIEHASGHNGKLLVSLDTATLTITQTEPGPDGNTAIVETLAANATITGFTGG